MVDGDGMHRDGGVTDIGTGCFFFFTIFYGNSMVYCHSHSQSSIKQNNNHLVMKHHVICEWIDRGSWLESIEFPPYVSGVHTVENY